MQTVSGTLPAVPPFDFIRTLRFLNDFTPAAGEQTVTDHSIVKALSVNRRAIAFEVSASGGASAERPAIAYTLFAETPISPDEQHAAAAHVSRFLSLDDDLRPFYARAEGDDAFAPVLRQLYGLHQLTFLTPFEIACWAVIAQRQPMPIARRVKDALVRRFGPSVTVGSETYWAFPEPAALAAADPADLAAIVRNERKQEYLRAVIAFFAATNEEWLRAGPFDEVAAAIRGIRGIGEWSASFILIRGLGRMERVPAADRELAAAAGRVYGNGASLTPEQLQPLLDRYGPYQGYWTYYLRIRREDPYLQVWR